MADACFKQQWSTDRILMYVTVVSLQMTWPNLCPVYLQVGLLLQCRSQTSHDMGYTYPGPDSLAWHTDLNITGPMPLLSPLLSPGYISSCQTHGNAGQEKPTQVFSERRRNVSRPPQKLRGTSHGQGIFRTKMAALCVYCTAVYDLQREKTIDPRGSRCQRPKMTT